MKITLAFEGRQSKIEGLVTLPSFKRKCNLHGEAPVTNAVIARNDLDVTAFVTGRQSKIEGLLLKATTRLVHVLWYNILG